MSNDSQSSIFKGKRFLVVDDDKLQRVLACEMLSSLGAQVDSVADGKDALEVLSGTLFDAVLTDYHMPIVNGYEFVKELRSRGFKGLVVCMSAAASSEELDSMIEVGADTCLLKPLTSHELANAFIEAALLRAN